ncbi:hypothetical protein [Rurimicrobium arvi]|uniref:Lipoprotein n=1 Tax=Rurimicrobium arvi TaxID=2049916 RepID=A0ABP8MTL8_9BACT
MKKTIMNIGAAAFVLFAATSMVACSNPQQKEENANEAVADARQDLAEAKQDAVDAHQEAVSDAEWQAFKQETNAKIDANDALISQLRKQKRKADNEMTEDAFKAHIDDLQAQNKQLRQRLDDYEKNKGDWNSFRTDYNRSLDELQNNLQEMKK